MKKRVLGLILMLVMALTLLPTTAEAADFTGWTKLSSGNYDLGIGKYYLTSDVTMSALFRTQSHANVTIDLNGHVLNAEWGVRVGPYSSLTILDSAPNALHTGSNAALPAGGVIRCISDNFDIGWDNFGTKYPATCYLNGGTIMSSRVNIMSGGKLYMNAPAHIKGGTVHLIASDYAPATTLYANGGMIDGEVSGYGIIENTASTVTSFYGGAAYNVKIKGGLFYGADLDGTKEGTTVTYESDGATYATQILPANGKAAEPDAPKKMAAFSQVGSRTTARSLTFGPPSRRIPPSPPSGLTPPLPAVRATRVIPAPPARRAKKARKATREIRETKAIPVPLAPPVQKATRAIPVQRAIPAPQARTA